MKKVLAVFLAAVIIFSFSGCTLIDYGKANKALKAKDYDAAASIYEELGDYKDSAEKLKECNYEQAQKQIDDGNYAEAIAGLEALGDYKDSTEKLQECNYEQAKVQIDDGDYAEAIAGLEALGDYQDSAALLKEAENEYLPQVLNGKWVSKDVDFSDLFYSSLKESLSDDAESLEFLDYFEMPDFKWTLILEFSDDGTVKESITEDSYEKAMKSLTKNLGEAVLAYFEAEMKAAAAANGISIDALLEYSNVKDFKELYELYAGQSFDDAVSELKEETSSGIVELNYEGTYTVENGKITIDCDGEIEIGTFDFEKEELTLTADDDSGNEKELFDALYPLVFTKE